MSLFTQAKTLATAQFREITGNFIPTLLTSSRPHIVPSTYLDKFGLPADHPHAIPIPDGHYAEHAAPAGSMLLPHTGDIPLLGLTEILGKSFRLFEFYLGL
ncbi:hypothetical protein M422DRAFT_249282 [Sphaerobolus stellatus SS14]|uniref:Uncharacterized protein n=1 Tax=Sphaerobolus stellatus (strain SS14) TaxID=990650 RepID=A0A0C9UVC1_SPHS4|nr:hypothetical protein M422DRAFT_249282 [Sphaerobolus stellatus SS14]